MGVKKMKLEKYILEHNKTLLYVLEVLNGGKTIANKIVDSGVVQNGVCFTFMPSKIDVKTLYQFKYGGLLQQNPIEEIVVLGKKYKARKKPKLNVELSMFIFNELSKNNKLSCLFEDYLAELTHPHIDLFYETGVSYNNEIYYLVNQKNLTQNLIFRCIKEMDLCWHGVIILSEVNLQDINNKQLSDKQVVELCHNIKTIIVGAYDGEGYVFWERQ